MNPRVVVAGGAGFIGSWLARKLATWKYPVRVIDDLSARGNVDPDTKDVEFQKADLTVESLTKSLFDGYDICVCLAARSSGIGFFNENPAKMLDYNVKILSSVFNAARTSRIRKLVYISSSCVFDNIDAYPITESSLTHGAPPAAGYPFSKLVGEYYCRAFFHQYGMPYTILRPFNVYGPGELPGDRPGDSHVIPDLTGKILRGQSPLEIFGDGKQTRCFTYIDDIADGILSAIESNQTLNEDFNLGFPQEISILALAQKLWTLCQRKDPFSVKCLVPFPIDARRRAVDISKAKKVLGWTPRVELDEGLRSYVAWFRDHAARLA